MCFLSGIIVFLAVATVFHQLVYHERRMYSMEITTPVHQQMIPFHSISVAHKNKNIHIEQVDQGELWTPSTKKYLWRVIQYRQEPMVNRTGENHTD